MKRFLLTTLLAALTLPGWAQSEDVPAGQPADTIARVGNDRYIRFFELNTILNSSPIVGLSIPALGTPERNEVMVTLLDKAVSSNLLYLDAVKQGKDQDPRYQRDMKEFSDAILAGLYRDRYLVGEIEVTREEVDGFFDNRIVEGTEMTQRLRTGIEATIRKEKFKERTATLRERLREGIEVRVHEENLNPADDALRDDADLVAEFGATKVAWGEVKNQFSTSDSSQFTGRRVAVVNDFVDQSLMARKGREAGLEQDPMYEARVGEFRKTRLVNLHREQLVRDMEPTEGELSEYYEQNKARIATEEKRRILMIVLATREEAQQIKDRIESGEITVFQAALDHSIDPNAKKTLGDFGWVSKGSGFPGLDELTFDLDLGELGGPVESPAGWHLVEVTDVVEASRTDIAEPETRKAARRMYIKEKLNQYVVNLRRNEFPVVVYEDNLKRLFREEAEWIAAKTREMEANPERQQQLLDELRRAVE